MKRIIHLGLAALVAAGVPSAASAQTGLAVSPPEQTVADFGREWRRARKMARACGALPDFMEFLSFSEGVLIAAKAEEQRELGKDVYDDATRYVIGFADDFDVDSRACQRHMAALARVLQPISEAFDTGTGLVLYLPPTVACPAGRPC